MSESQMLTWLVLNLECSFNCLKLSPVSCLSVFWSWFILLTHACAFDPTPSLTQLPTASLKPSSSSACSAHALYALTDTDLSLDLFLVLNDGGGSRGREGYRSVGGSSESMNGYEELVRLRGREPGATCSTPLSRNSHNAPGFTSSSSMRPGRRPKGNAKLCRLVDYVSAPLSLRPCSFCHAR